MTSDKNENDPNKTAFEALLVEHVQAAVIGLDAHGRIQSWNRSTADLLGWTAEEVQGAALVDLLRPSAGSGELLRDMLAVLESYPTAQTQGAFTARDGRLLDLLVQASALRGQDGALQGAAVTLSTRLPDETLRQELMLFRGLSGSTPNLVAAMDEQFRFVMVNPACARAFKRMYGKAACLGLNILDLLADFPEDRQRMRELLVDALNGQIVRGTDMLGSPRHEQIVLEAIFHPIRDAGGRVVAVGLLGRDITEQSRLQQALADSNAHYHALAIASFEGVIISEGDNIVDLNEQLAEMLGYQAGELIGKPVLSFIAPEDHPLVLNYVESGGTGTFEVHLMRKNGARMLVETRGRLIFYQDRTVRVSTIRDITTQRAALEALRESEERYSTLFNNRHSPMLLIDPASGQIVEANPAATLFYGWDREKLLKMKITEINQLPPDVTFHHMGQANAAETSRRFSFQHRLASGEIRDVDVQSGPIRIAGKDFLFSIIIDVTDRKRAERALLESESVRRKANDRFRLVVENIPDVIALYDRDLRIQYINSATTRITGMQPAEFIGRRDEEIWPREIYEGYLPMLTEAFATGETQTIETDLVLENGKMHSVVITCVPLLDDSGAVTEVMGITHDNTERIQVEEALRESESMFRAIARNIPNGGVMVVDDELRIAAAEGSIWARMGIESEIVLGRAIPGAGGGGGGETAGGGDSTAGGGEKPADKTAGDKAMYRIVDAFRRALNGEALSFEMEYKDRVLFAQFVSLQEDETMPASAMALVLDITDPKAVELALRESESVRQKANDRFRTSVESLMDGFAILTAVREQGRIIDFRYEYMNEAGRLMSRTTQEPVGLRLLEYLPGQKESGMFDRYLHLMETGEPVEVEDIEYIDLPDGGQQTGRTFEVRAIKLDDGFVVTWHDITQRRETQQQLLTYAEKLERSNKELEQFAFVASHDLQEPLRKIRMFGNSLRQKLGNGLPEDAEEYLSRIQISSDRMQTMINGLLDLSRVSTRGRTFTRVDLNQTLEEVLSDLEPRIQSSRGKVAAGKLPVLEADEMQMRQLLQNLIGNALKFHRQEVPPEVRISIGSHRHAEGVVTIVVEDNGIGFEEQYIERIFEPFQRLHGRSEYEGSGIGLSICRRIVERHHGSILVRSAPGQGASFSITLPLKQPRGGVSG